RLGTESLRSIPSRVRHRAGAARRHRSAALSVGRAHMAAPVKRLLRLAAAALMISGGLSVRISAQNASAPALKAAFLVNFAKFAEWPAGTLAPDGAISFCVV